MVKAVLTKRPWPPTTFICPLLDRSASALLPGQHSEDDFVGPESFALPVDPVNAGFVKVILQPKTEEKIVAGRQRRKALVPRTSAWSTREIEFFPVDDQA